MVKIWNWKRNFSKVGTGTGTITFSKVGTGTGTLTFQKSEPEPSKIVTVPQHCLKECGGELWARQVRTRGEPRLSQRIPVA